MNESHFRMETRSASPGRGSTSADALERCLDGLVAVLPEGAVSLDQEDRLHHADDRWPMSAKRRQRGLVPPPPTAVVRPASRVQVQEVVKTAALHKVPLTAWGAGSSVVGQAVPDPAGLCVDLGQLDAILDIDLESLYVHVQAGAIGSDVEAAVNATGHTLNFSPQSLHCSTVGGWVATRATGQFSARWGGIEHALLGLTAVLPNGELFTSRPVARPGVGPDCKQLFVGAEGILGIVTDVVLRMYPLPETRHLQTVHFSDLTSGLAAIRQIMSAGLRPFLLRLYDEDESQHALGMSGFRGSALLLGTEGVERVATAELDAAASICEDAGGVLHGPRDAAGWMDRRYDFSEIQSVLERPGGVAETIDVSHTWSGIQLTHQRLKEALRPLADQLFGHFSHPYTTGTSLYLIILAETGTAAEAEDRLASIWEAAMTTCLETGAEIAHHHGVGLARLPWLDREPASERSLLETVKRALDPLALFAPGRLIRGRAAQ